MALSARVAEHWKQGSAYRLLRLEAPALPAPQPGQCLLLTMEGNSFTLPIIGATPHSITCLYPVVENLPPRLTSQQTNDVMEIEALKGTPFSLPERGLRPLLLADAAGMAAIFFLTEIMHRHHSDWRPLVVLEGHNGFPFTPHPSRIMIHGLPPWVIATAPLLEDWGVAARLCTDEEQPGTYDGSAMELAEQWLQKLPTEQLGEVEIIAAGTKNFLAQTQDLAEQFGLQIQLGKICDAELF